MLGSYYYLGTKSDWVYTSVYENMFNRQKAKILASEGFDVERVDAMEEYVDKLEQSIEVVTGNFNQLE